jgi:hypothetical protein
VCGSSRLGEVIQVPGPGLHNEGLVISAKLQRQVYRRDKVYSLEAVEVIPSE